MSNNVVLIGRLVSEPELQETENEKKYLKITLAVNREFKSSDGNYYTDFIDCVFWNNSAKNLNLYCKKGDLIGVRGRIQVDTFEDNNGDRKKVTKIVAERLTFLSSAKPKNEVE